MRTRSASSLAIRLTFGATPPRRALSGSFFFSSRRRHTRLVSDWSSDVCSSDLCRPPHLRAGRRGQLLAAGSGFAHLPEVVLVAQPEDAAVGNPGALAPQSPRLVVRVVHGDVQPVGIDAEPVLPGHPLPGVVDRLALEVVAEGEVAEHLEEGVGSRGVAHLLQVIVLPPGAHAFLAGHGSGVSAPLESLEHPLELHHPGVGEQQGGVVRRDQGGARHLLVAPRLEELQELAADFGGGHGGNIVPPHSSSTSSFTPAPAYPRRTRKASNRRLRTGPGRSESWRARFAATARASIAGSMPSSASARRTASP